MGTIRRLVNALLGDNETTNSQDLRDPRHSEGLSPEAVLWAYRLFLDREAESDLVVDEHLRKCLSTQELRHNFIYSSEFKEKNPTLHIPVLVGDEPRMSIENVCSDQDLEKLFKHIQSTWQELGEIEPHWSVIASEEFRQSNMQGAKEIFYRTGEPHVAQLFGSLERNRVQYHGFETCLDYGCGVGRITRHLSDRFKKVFAYDISLAHLRHAAEYLKEENVSNVTLTHLSRVRDIEKFPKVDVVYSMLVLQHNPPPVIEFVMEGLLSALNPGGIALFQVPTYRLGYSFSLSNYLANQASKREMEMHVLPQSSVFEIAERAGGRVLEVIDDGWTGIRLKEVSNTFIIQKKQR